MALATLAAMQHRPGTATTVVDALLPSGERTSFRVEDGVVTGIGAAPCEGDRVIDAAGRLVLPAMAEAHAHLDKAFLAERVPNPTGDLVGAIESMERHLSTITRTDIEERAERAARLIAMNGATVIRTHVDLTDGTGLTNIEALLAVRDRLAHIVDIQVFALCSVLDVFDPASPGRALVREAIARGVDGLGGCPHLESDPDRANDLFLSLAAEAGLPLDLHTDETLDPTHLALADLAERVLDLRPPVAVTASHCVSLGVQSLDTQRRVAERLAAAGVAVVALPSSNLFLQGRQHPVAMPRGLAPVGVLRAAGVTVAAGADNLQDPFNPVGRGDCLETAALMVMAGHLLPDDAYDSVAGAARQALGLPAAGVTEGAAADLVLLRAATAREAIAAAPGDRLVLRRGIPVRA